MYTIKIRVSPQMHIIWVGLLAFKKMDSEKLNLVALCSKSKRPKYTRCR